MHETDENNMLSPNQLLQSISPKVCRVFQIYKFNNATGWNVIDARR